jgi:hypothetical protein
MSEPAPGRDALPRVNRWEIALWVIGVVFVVLSLVFGFLAIEYLYSSSGPVEQSISDQLVQIALQLSPSVLTAGLMSIILAIVVRALRANVRHPSIAAAPVPVVETIEIVQPSPVPSRATAKTDQSLFMRPSEDRAKQGG